MKTLVVIPARYASTRFPGKPLAQIHGKSMIQRVYEQVQQSKKSTAIIVATDDERIKKHVQEFGGEVAMTGDHTSGTDRCFEVWSQQTENFDFMVNVQGDEPYIAPEAIDGLIGCLEEKQIGIATLANKSSDEKEFENPNCVKIALNHAGEALYFSRANIPFHRESQSLTFYKHIGIYGFAKKVIPELQKLKTSQLEDTEKLEQLKWLDFGIKIGVEITSYKSFGVDVPEDINRL